MKDKYTQSKKVTRNSCLRVTFVSDKSLVACLLNMSQISKHTDKINALLACELKLRCLNLNGMNFLMGKNKKSNVPCHN